MASTEPPDISKLPKARTAQEVALEQAQVDIVKGMQADERRKRLILDFALNGMSQGEIAARLTRGSLRAGGPIVSENAVQKLLRRLRASEARKLEHLEDEVV